MIKRHWLIVSSLFMFSIMNAQNNLKLWYTQPAKVWEEALPLGNGYLGAMDYGNPKNENFQLNEKTLWSGFPDDGLNELCKDAIPLIRERIDAGDYKGAGDLWINNCQGPYTARYLPMANLHIDMPSGAKVKMHNRSLDISRAVSSVDFNLNDVHCTRTSFISYPDRVMVIHYESEKNGTLNFDISLKSKLHNDVKFLSANELQLDGVAPDYIPFFERDSALIRYDGKGLRFQVRLKTIADGGMVLPDKDSKLSVRNAHKVTILLSGLTNYRDFNRYPDYDLCGLSVRNENIIRNAEYKGYDLLMATHIADYRSLYSTFEIGIGKPLTVDVSTTDLLKNKKKGDTEIYRLLFQYGRYLTISSSRKGSLPSNLQGIWNDVLIPKWGCNYTNDMNLQMNYWLAEPTALSECHKSLLDYIETLAISGEKTAKNNYGISEGWMVHSNSDVWGQTVPQGGYDKDFEVRAAKWTCWQMAGLWLAQHLWEHYDFNRDLTYLRLYAYPLMKGAAKFALNWLYKDSQSGYLVTSPSTSPENRFWYVDKDGKRQLGDVCKAATMDMELIWNLFTDCIEASRVLGIDEDFATLLKQKKNQLVPLQIGKHGQIQEWMEDFDEPEIHHRHLSHLFGLYPGKQIIPRRDLELASAAKTTLLRRENKKNETLWSLAWGVCLWSRLEDSEKAMEILDRCVVYRNYDIKENARPGFSSNLFSLEPVFQIDAILGIVAGMTEMLLQSYAEELFLLPALPKEWDCGYVRGLKARGNFTVDMKWNDNSVKEVIISSLSGGNCIIRTFVPLVSNDVELVEITDNDMKHQKEKFLKNTDKKINGLKLKKTYIYSFNTEKNKSYCLFRK